MSNREKIIKLHDEGMSNVNIARKLGFSPQWVSRVISQSGRNARHRPAATTKPKLHPSMLIGLAK